MQELKCLSKNASLEHCFVGLLIVDLSHAFFFLIEVRGEALLGFLGV